METQRPPKQEKEPASSEVTEAAPGVLRLQLPIRMPGLGHVNAYLLEDERGAAVVDPGLPGPGTWRSLARRLRDAGVPLRRIHTVLVTHSHPDHYGSAGRLAHEAGAELVTHAAFRTRGAPHHHDHGGDDDAPTASAAAEAAEAADAPRSPFEGPTPWGGQGYQQDWRRRLRSTLLRTRLRRLFTPPAPSVRVEDGEVLRLAGREWQAVHTPGHTLDHLCLLDPAEGILLSGDHVLPTITPHISGIGTGPDPLAEFLASLERVGQLDVKAVLPAHGHPFADLAGRTAAIAAHHHERLDRLRRALDDEGPATVDDLSHHLFAPRSWGGMASSETYAHLEHLRLAGEARREEEGGLLRYAPPR